MLAKMQDTFRTMGKHFHDFKISQPPTFNFQGRTELTWARVLDSYDKVPEAYREFFARFTKEKVFPYTVFTPAFETLGYKITEKVVCVLDDEIHVLERNARTLIAQCYPLMDISYVESSRMLLDSRVRISGITSEGTSTSSIVRFSSATDYIFAPILRKIRLYSVTPGNLTKGKDLEKFNPWMDLNFKFMNMARQSLLGGEKVIHAILQPEIRKPIFAFWGKTYSRMLAPTQAVILTDRELIVIREDAQHSRKDRYGGIWQYIPLNKITTLSMNERNDDLLAISIRLITGEQFEYPYQASIQDEVESLLTRFRMMKNDQRSLKNIQNSGE